LANEYIAMVLSGRPPPESARRTFFSEKKAGRFPGSPGEVLPLVREDLHPCDRDLLCHTREPEGLWREYALQTNKDVTLTASHRYGSVNRNTMLLWRQKLLACLSSVASWMVFSGTVWIDEIYFNVLESDRIRADSGSMLHGISRNKVCVELAVDSSGRAFGKVMLTTPYVGISFDLKTQFWLSVKRRAGNYRKRF
jgi:hypothetical protein